MGGRPKLTPKQKMERKALLDHYKWYLENGQSVKDFERARETKPLECVKEACDRIYGKPRETVHHSGAVHIGAVKIIHRK